MTQLVFAPSKIDAGCVFADPTELSTAFEPSCPVVFMSPKLGNGCIFADPREIDEVIRRSRRRRQMVSNKGELTREDDEIMVIIMASVTFMN